MDTVPATVLYVIVAIITAIDGFLLMYARALNDRHYREMRERNAQQESELRHQESALGSLRVENATMRETIRNHDLQMRVSEASMLTDYHRKYDGPPVTITNITSGADANIGGDVAGRDKNQ